MNKQKKVLITITYNEMGIIIDTKAEEVAKLDLQPTCNQLATDCISRQAAIDAINHICPVDTEYDCTLLDRVDVRCVLSDLPPAQPDTGNWIPVSWRPAEGDEARHYMYMFTCEMPCDGQEILVTTDHGCVEKDINYIDDGFHLDSGYDWRDDIKAWMPLPEPYAERRKECL